MRVKTIVVITLASLCVTAALAQGKSAPSKTLQSREQSRAAVVQAMKCNDPATVSACKSFKQLFAAQDKNLIDSVLGFDFERKRHVSYICFRPGEDTFMIVDYSRPELNRYHSLPSGAYVQMFLDFNPSGKSKLFGSAETREIWQGNQDPSYLYASGSASLSSYQKGIQSDLATDTGQWKILGTEGDKYLTDEGTSFEGVHYWLERFNTTNGKGIVVDDEPRRAHIGIDDSQIYVHYSYDNKANSLTNYTLVIQPVTGRFTERFDAPGMDPSEDSGKCAVFK